MDKADDVVVGLHAWSGKRHMDAWVVHPMRLVGPIAHQDGRFTSVSTSCDQVRELGKVDAGKVRRQHTDDVQDVVGIDEEGHA